MFNEQEVIHSLDIAEPKETVLRSQFRKKTAKSEKKLRESRDFSKIGDVLSCRLKKTLVDKYVGGGRRDSAVQKRESEIMSICQEKVRKMPSKPQTAHVNRKKYFDNQIVLNRVYTGRENPMARVKREYSSQIDNILEMADS